MNNNESRAIPEWGLAGYLTLTAYLLPWYLVTGLGVVLCLAAHDIFFTSFFMLLFFFAAILHFAGTMMLIDVFIDYVSSKLRR